MAFFGLPGTDPAPTSTFLGRIQFDARVGFWKLVKRVQASDGGWMDEETEPFQKPTFAVDFPSLEIGYIKYASPPVFVLEPFGGPLPTCPAEMGAPDPITGRSRKAYQPGFRVKLWAPKLYGSTDPFYFSNTSKSVLEPLDMLHQQFLASAEGNKGQIPVVASPANRKVETSTPRGTSTFYSPVFEVVTWIPRPRELGEIPLVTGGSATAPPSNGTWKSDAPGGPVRGAPAPGSWGPVVRGAPAPGSWDTGVAMPARAAAEAPRATFGKVDLDDEIPF
jgi:hypothetical protein